MTICLLAEFRLLPATDLNAAVRTLLYTERQGHSTYEPAVPRGANSGEGEGGGHFPTFWGRDGLIFCIPLSVQKKRQ